jgi:hypothetical protein
MIFRHIEIPDEWWRKLEATIPDRVRRDRFVARDLPNVKAAFRDHWDDGALLPSMDNPYLRSLFGNLSLGGFFAVAGLLRPDGVIEFVDVKADGLGLPSPEAD